MLGFFGLDLILAIIIQFFPMIVVGLLFFGVIQTFKRKNEMILNKPVTIPGVKNTSSNSSASATPVVEAQVDPTYNMDLDSIVKNYISEEIKNNNIDISKEPYILIKRKNILTIIFSLLTFILISLIFFNISNLVIVLEVINIIIYLVFIRKMDVYKYMVKEIKNRPDEDISNVVVSIFSENRNNNYKIYRILGVFLSFILPLVLFIKPMMFYEKFEDGYRLRFYTSGVINSNKIVVPEKHNGKYVRGIRGNVFANLDNIEEIVLPDSITEIRGQTFKNDVKLKKINLPSNLTYLGGSAFYNCKSLETIEIPNGVTEINGETFKGCTSLREVKLHDNIIDIHGEAFSGCISLEYIDLPNKITEIHGNTFENCRSLKEVSIPDSVTRIGGHAFYGCSSLSMVNISENSNLTEIGSSAFRMCSSLYSINLPRSVSINERAFKESPTNISYYGTSSGWGSYGY